MKTRNTKNETLKDLVERGRRLHNQQIRETAKRVYNSLRKLFDITIP